MNPGGKPTAALVSAALRLKQRRLRSWWRHEQLSIAAVLATASHHSYPKVDTANAAQRGQKIGTSTGVGPAEHFELSSDDGRPTAGTRQASMLEHRPQRKMQRHSGIGYELVLALDALVLQMVDQFVDVLQFFRTPGVAEQVIEVPMIILQDQIPQRTVLCDPQLAEQLVEVPTVVSHPSLQRQFAEQNVDIPVPSGHGLMDGGGLQGFLPEQCPTARGFLHGGGLQGFVTGQGSTALL